MHEGLEAEPSGLLDGFVGTGIIGDDDLIDEIQGDFAIGPFEGTSRVVRGHDNDDSFSVEQGDSRRLE